MNHEEIEAKRQALEAEYKVKVHAIVLHGGEDKTIVAYLKEPSRLTKMKSLDMSIQSFTQAADILITESIIKEESSPEFFDEKNDQAYLGLIMEAQKLVKFFAAAVKKN